MANAPLISGSLAVLGAGAMATALVKAWISAGLVLPQQITAADFAPERRTLFVEMGTKAVATAKEAIMGANVVLIAVKPQQMPVLLQEIQGLLPPGTLVISIAAGIPVSMLEQAFGAGSTVVRVMPNTPCLVGASATGICAGNNATTEQVSCVKSLFQAVGLAYVLPEKLLDVVTGLSGSGPAYIYLIIEALSDGGVAAGLPRDIATSLAAQTVLGAARMVVETGSHPAVLREMVTSPAGTTVAGLLELESHGVRAALTKAVVAAAQRSHDLGNGTKAK